MCPSVPKLAAVAGYSGSSIKRAIKELETYGWLERTDGRGTGRFTKYRLRWPEKVATLQVDFDNDDEAFQKITDGPLRGTSLVLKRSRGSFQEVMDEPFYNNHSSNQKKRSNGNSDHLSTQCPAIPTRLITKDMSAQLREWDQKLAEWNLPPIKVLAVNGIEGNKEGLLWPYRWVPSDPLTLARVEAYARWLFEARFGDNAATRKRCRA